MAVYGVREKDPLPLAVDGGTAAPGSLAMASDRAQKRWLMRGKLVAAAILTLALPAVLTACDTFAEYTVINQTDQELTTWPFFEGCAAVVSDKQDNLHEEVIKPRERHVYFEAYWGPEAKCVLVVTKDRRLVLAERYEYGGTYTVREPLQPFGDPIPEQADLPNQSWGETLREMPPIFFIVVPFAFLFGVAFVVACLFGIVDFLRFLYRRYMGKSRSPS